MADDPKCIRCNFLEHSHGKYSHICPILVNGMLSQFQAAGEAEPDPPADQHPAESLADMLEFVFDLRGDEVVEK